MPPALSNKIILANELVMVIKKEMAKQHESFLLLWYNILPFNQDKQNMNFYCNTTDTGKKTMIL